MEKENKTCDHRIGYCNCAEVGLEWVRVSNNFDTKYLYEEFSFCPDCGFDLSKLKQEEE